MRRLVRHLAGALSLSLLPWTFSLSESSVFHAGEPFPDLLLPDAETGRPTSLADFRGRKLVLHVFASW